MKKLLKILKMTQDELKTSVTSTLQTRGYKDVTCTKDYVYAKGEIPVLLVAHLDIVHKETPKDIYIDTKEKVLWCPTGIGGDDRCGVYAILQTIKKFKPYVLFTTDEEIGCLGAKVAVKEIEDIPVNFIIEIDRRGCGQSVYYDCGNEEFQKYINSFGFETQKGSCSDICTLSRQYGIASVNLSAGYLNEHQKHEFINMNWLNYTIGKIAEILKDKANHKKYDYEEIKPVYSYPNYNYNYDYWDNYYKNKKDNKDSKDNTTKYYGNSAVKPTTSQKEENKQENLVDKKEDEKEVEVEETEIDEVNWKKFMDDYEEEYYEKCLELYKADFQKMTNEEFKNLYWAEKPKTLEDAIKLFDSFIYDEFYYWQMFGQ